MDPRYVERYHRLHDHHWWWQARQEEILRLLRRLQPAGGFGPILDVGCGDGLLLPALEAFGVPRGVELDEDAVSEAGRRSGRIHIGPFDDDYQPGERFGLVLMLDVIEHLDDDVAALRRARELLRGDGRVLVTVPAFQLLWTGHDDWNHHRRRYRRASLSAAAERAGLEVLDSDYFFHWLFLPKLAVRLRETIFGASEEPAEVPPAPFNAAALAVSRLENRCFSRLRPPFGSSLRAVLAPAG